MIIKEYIGVCIYLCIVIIAISFGIYIHFRTKHREKRALEQRQKEYKEFIINYEKQKQIEKEREFEKLKESYEPRYLMTINEKAQFRKIQNWAKQNNLIVFTKVRLLDLITPRSKSKQDQSLLWKIQAKHVDFVVCDQNINIKCIIEINDNSHTQEKRRERDKFVREVLEACGYKVLQTYNTTEEELDEIIKDRLT